MDGLKRYKVLHHYDEQGSESVHVDKMTESRPGTDVLCGDLRYCMCEQTHTDNVSEILLKLQQNAH